MNNGVSWLAGVEAGSRLSSSHCALLLGWVGSRHSQLEKYAKIYSARGIDSLSFVADFKLVSDSNAALRDISKLVPSLDEVLRVKQRRLLVHILGTNGVFTLVSLLHSTAFRDMLKQTDLIVWDSCPVDFTSLSLNHSLGDYGQVIDKVQQKWQAETALLKPFIWKYWLMSRVGLGLLRASQIIYNSGWPSIEWFGTSILSQKKNDSNPYFYLRDHPDLPSNHVFVFSDADQLVPAPPITAFHEYLHDQRGHRVRPLHFIDSPHVQHLRFHRKEYEAAIDGALGDIQNAAIGHVLNDISNVISRTHLASKL